VGRRINVARNKFAPKTGTSTGGHLNVSIIWHGLRHDGTLYVQNKCEYEWLNSEQMAVTSHAKKGRSGKEVDLPLYYEFTPISLNTSHIKVCECPHLNPVSVILCTRLRRIARSDSSYRDVCLSTWKNTATSRGIFTKFDIWRFLENLLKNFKFD
jgi:hypothetical protein